MNSSNNDVEIKVAECYSTWGPSYFDDYYGDKAPYPPVHVGIVKDLLAAAKPKSLLDAGCGPASLMRYLFDNELELYGFDLTDAMVAEAKVIMASLGVDSKRVWKGSALNKADYTRPNGPERYDSALCFGVLPHIPSDQDSTVLGNLYDSLESGGLAIVEARNSLFSLFTQNRYSYDFITQELIQNEKLLSSSGDNAHVLESALVRFRSHFRMDLPPIRKGKEGEPGYDEVLSRTHNPFVLSSQMSKVGFQDVRTLFYHFHALPPMLAAGIEEFFKKSSIQMENPADWRGYFMASAFIMVGRKW
jgi:2-polyprenyl-3-methyl-5-hydroxy-6-metoxy-1,4-benzoquinol methylase